MDDLCFKIDTVLNQCSRSLRDIEKEDFNKSFCRKNFKVSGLLVTENVV